MTSLGKKIKHARKRAKLSQVQLAQRMGFASNADGSVCKWESGEREPKLGNIRKLADALGVRVGTLLK